VLPYLKYSGARNVDLHLEVSLQPSGSGSSVISRSNFKFMYWNMSQQLAHHTCNGCNIQVGDVYASGTISGPTADSYGSLLELTWNGSRALTLQGGITRTYIEDGDEVRIRGFAEKDGVRIGFGDCAGRILPAL
jgi:fumarylacetoacetase